MNQAILAAGTERPAMNETVRHTLTLARIAAKSDVANAEAAMKAAERSIEYRRQTLDRARSELADLDAALTEAGVDLAAEDAKAAERAASSGSLSTLNALNREHGQALGGNDLAQLSGVNANARRQ